MDRQKQHFVTEFVLLILSLHPLQLSVKSYAFSVCLQGKPWGGPRKRWHSGGEILMLVRLFFICSPLHSATISFLQVTRIMRPHEV